MRKRVAVIFGGRSGEHEVSLMSAESVMSALDPQRYEVVPVGIGRDGRWWTGAGCLEALRRGTPEEVQRAAFLPDPAHPGLHTWDAEGRLRPVPVDVVFPVLHGPYGEDGTLQGLLEMAGHPYVGSEVAASAVGMDKTLMKLAFAAAGLPQVRYKAFPSARWYAEPARVEEEIAGELGFPCFVKPASLGSSVGVSRADGPGSLGAALDEAASLSQKVVVEEAVLGFREIELAVLGNGPVDVSVPGEVVPAVDYYDYRAKYKDERTQLVVPADVKPATARTLAGLASRAFEAIEAKGLARVDFFVSPDEKTIFVNEINTMPGFTRVSMYPRLWASSGVGYEALVDRLIGLAFERHREKLRVAKAQEAWRPRG